MHGGDDRLRLVIKGPSLSPQNIPSVSALELARSYLDLLHRVADESARASLVFEGIWIEKGSAVLAFKVSSPGVAKDAVQQAGGYLRGHEVPPPGLTDPVRRVRAAMLHLPSEFDTVVHIGAWKRALEVVPDANEELLGSVTTLRAVPVRVGGVHPAVRFRSPSEEGDFTLRVADEEAARSFGGLLYREVEIVATVFRDENHDIVAGEVQDFRPVEEGDALAAWRVWYRAHGADWDSLDAADSALRDERDD